MAKFLGQKALDNGLNHIRNNADEVWLLRNYTQGDSYIVVDSNKVAAAAISVLNWSLAGAGTLGRRLTFTGATGTADGSVGANAGDLHFAFIDTDTSEVLFVTDETSESAVLDGSSVEFPSVSCDYVQPV